MTHGEDVTLRGLSPAVDRFRERTNEERGATVCGGLGPSRGDDKPVGSERLHSLRRLLGGMSTPCALGHTQTGNDGR